MLPESCTLDPGGLSEQLARYRSAGAGAEVIVRSPRRITIRVGEHADDAVIAELIETERTCCPFYELEYHPAERQLSIGVATQQHEPALEAIAYALGLPG